MKKSRSSTEHNRSASAVLYWSTILFLTMMNFFVALVLVPFSLAAPTFQLYLAVAIFGLLFGHLFNILITRIEFLERHHHLFASIFIPLIAIVALLIVLSAAESIAAVLGITVTQNPKITMVIYIAAFLTPNTLSRIMKH
ncbi:MAG: hypothetical protein V1702_01675 [Candidatus Woesearchaeota archaeon]